MDSRASAVSVSGSLLRSQECAKSPDDHSKESKKQAFLARK